MGGPEKPDPSKPWCPKCIGHTPFEKRECRHADAPHIVFIANTAMEQKCTCRIQWHLEKLSVVMPELPAC